MAPTCLAERLVCSATPAAATSRFKCSVCVPPADREAPGGQGTNCTTVKAGVLLLQSLIRGGGARTMLTGLLPALPSSVCSRILPLLLFPSLLALKEEFCFGFLGSCDIESKRDGDGGGLWSTCPLYNI